MRQASKRIPENAEETVRDIRRATRGPLMRPTEGRPRSAHSTGVPDDRPAEHVRG